MRTKTRTNSSRRQISPVREKCDFQVVIRVYTNIIEGLFLEKVDQKGGSRPVVNPTESLWPVSVPEKNNSYFVHVLLWKACLICGSYNLYNYHYAESMFILQARGISISTYASGSFQVNRFLYTTVLDNSIQFPQFVFLYQQRVSVSIGCIHCSATCALSQQ